MRTLIPLFLLLATAGCHTPMAMGPDRFPAPGPRHEPRPDQDQRDRHDYDDRGRPLHASVWFDEYTGYASFDVSRRAHVALFAMRPAGAVEMIYPSWGYRGRDRSFRAGQHRVRTDSRPYSLAGTRGFGRYDPREPLYIILIASDRPLQLGALHATRTAHWLNHPAITWSPFLVADRLASEIIPGHGRAEWTVAYHVVWPHAGFHRRDGRVPRSRVVCPGGTVVWASTQAVDAGWYRCPDRDYRPRRGRPDQGRRGDDYARPATPVAPPIRGTLPTRPRPAGWEGARPTAAPAPRSSERSRPLRAIVTRPNAKPASGAEAESRARPSAEGRGRPSPSARPAPPRARPKPRARPEPTARSRPSSRPSPRPRPKPKPGGGGGEGV